jgi:hypothetical protein
MKSMWKIINEEKGKTQQGTDIPSLVIDNTEIRNQKKIANTFNNYFLSIADLTNRNNNNYTNTQINNPINYLLNSFKRPFTEISWQYASTYEIAKIIKSFKTKNTAGYDEISNRFLKLSAPFIISPLTYICNAVLCTGSSPIG